MPHRPSARPHKQRRPYAFGLLAALICLPTVAAPVDECLDWRTNHPKWIWCDDFEGSLRLADDYGSANISSDQLEKHRGVAAHGQHSLRFGYSANPLSSDRVNPGHIRRNFGRVPFPNTPEHRGARPWQSHENFTEIYYRYFHLLPDGFEGWPDKYSRVFSVHEEGATPWQAQSFIAHTWWFREAGKLGIDPATGVNPDAPLTRPRTTQWNDFHKLYWLNKGWPESSRYGDSELTKGHWHCIEIHVQLNDTAPPFDNGIFQLWIDDVPQISRKRQSLNWRGAFAPWGINGIQLESYWNSGSPREQARYFDALVVSRTRIGCTIGREGPSGVDR